MVVAYEVHYKVLGSDRKHSNYGNLFNAYFFGLIVWESVGYTLYNSRLHILLYHRFLKFCALSNTIKFIKNMLS